MNFTDFLPNVKCPHCGKSFVTPVGGFGREGYNSRQNICKYCKRDIVVEVVVKVSKPEDAIADIFLSGVDNSIDHIRRTRKKSYQEKLELLQMLQEYHRRELEEIETLTTETAGSC